MSAVLYDMPPEEYHAHPALSSSAIRRLMPPSVPALFRYWQTHEMPTTRSMDKGSIAHTYVLTEGEVVGEVDAPDYRTKAAREERDAVRASGRIPLLKHEHDTVKAMAAEIRRNKLAMAILDPSKGRPEVSLFWDEEPDDDGLVVPCRARIDWLRVPTVGRVTGLDYKTCTDVSRAGIEKSVARYSYDVQEHHYERGALRTGVAAADFTFLFLFQDTNPPYLCHVVQLPPEWKALAERRWKAALDLYRRCVAADEWPGYGDEITELSMPRWVEDRALEDA